MERRFLKSFCDLNRLQYWCDITIYNHINHMYELATCNAFFLHTIYVSTKKRNMRDINFVFHLSLTKQSTRHRVTHLVFVHFGPSSHAYFKHMLWLVISCQIFVFVTFEQKQHIKVQLYIVQNIFFCILVKRNKAPKLVLLMIYGKTTSEKSINEIFVWT